MSVSRTVYEIFSVEKGVTLKLGYGSFKVIESGDLLLVGHCKYSCMLYHFQVICY